MGNSKLQGELWGARPQQWARFEDSCMPLHEAVLDTTGVGHGTRLLDAGCGSGVAVALATQRGADVSGLDAAPGLIAIARKRAPHADLRVGDLESLPFPDDTFDVVTGINSFQYTSDRIAALHEAKRVARPGGLIASVVWDVPENCDLAGYINALGSLLPPGPADAPGPWAISEDGAIEQLMRDADLEPASCRHFKFSMRYASEDEAVQVLLSPAPASRAIAHCGEAVAAQAIRDSIAPCRRPDGGYEFENSFRIVVAPA